MRKTNDKVRERISEIRRTRLSEMPAHEKRALTTEVIIADLKSKGSLFKTPRGLFYFEKDEVPRLFSIDKGAIGLSAMIDERYGINGAERTEYEHVLNGLCYEAHLRGRSVNVHRLAHYDHETGRLYLSRFDGWVYRLNGRSILQVPNGTDDVFFWDDPQWQPYEVFRGRLRGNLKNGLLKPLVFDSVNFTDEDALTADDQRWLFSVWLRSHFFASLLPTKPLLLICGEKGSGKTLAMRRWLRLLFGPSGELASLERDKPDGFVAAVCSNPVIALDNVDERVGWLADKLAQLATGISYKRRELYTTNKHVDFKPECFVALNSRTPKFIDGRDDVLDRTLILQTERRKDFVAEHELLEEIAVKRNSLWTELLRGLNKLLSVTPPKAFRARTNFRMADFAGFALAVARAEGVEGKAARILECLEGRRSEMLLGQEPIFLCLEKWLGETENCGRQVSSGELHIELSDVARVIGVSWPHRSGHSLGQRLANIASNLGQSFRVETTKDSANQLRYRFWPRAESLNRAESPTDSIQAV
jgi:hypothetical protein